MKVYYTPEFISCVKQAKRFGGQAATGINKALIAMQLSELDERNPLGGMKTSNNPDSRLKGLVKYHPSKNYRLITVQNGAHCIFLFYGDHDDVDRWLEKNKGKSFTLDDSTNQVFATNRSSTNSENQFERVTPNLDPGVFHGVLWDKFPEDNWDVLTEPFPNSYIRPLSRLEAGIEPDDLLAACERLEEYERDQPEKIINHEYPASLAILDVLSNLNAGRFDEAKANFDFYRKRTKDFTEVDPDRLDEIEDSGSIKQLVPGSYEFDVLLKGSLNSSNLEWLFFTHPDQDRFVKEDYEGSAILQGVSGSGKTGILVKRAARLAKDGNANILIVTLNDSLSLVLADLIKLAVNDDDAFERIMVLSYFQLCQKLLRQFDPDNSKSYTRVTDIVGQHSDEIFREFYRCETNNRSAEVLLPVHRSLSARGLDAEKYVNDEFDWIRSAVAPDSLQDYLSVERKGRKVQITKAHRQHILDGLFGWKDKMSAVGVLDDAEISHKIYEYLEKPLPQFTSVLVDEAQDLGTLELMTLRKLAPKGPNDIFLACDIAQTILPKKNDFSQAGYSFGSRVFKLQKNYRNSREILTLAREILWNSIDDAFIDESSIDLLEPDFANRTGDLPVIMEAETLGAELAGAKEYCQNYISKVDSSANCCIILSGYSKLEVASFGTIAGIPTLDAKGNFSDELITLSDMETVKGLEFDVVFIVNCNAQNLPPQTHAKEEHFRDGCRLYVAMTRAKHRLILSYSGEISPWLEQLNEAYEYENAEVFFDLDNLQRLPTPEHLAEVTDADERSNNPVLDLTGDRFEYTSYARTVPVNVLNWFVKSVKGKSEFSKTGERHRVAWENMRQLLQDMRTKKQTGVGPSLFFSKENDDSILELLEIVEIAENKGLEPDQGQTANVAFHKAKTPIKT